LLYVGVSASSTVSRSDPLVSRCPLIVALPSIETQEQYAQVGRSRFLVCVEGGGGIVFGQAVGEVLSSTASGQAAVASGDVEG
jgi:hypothetical protein